MSRQIVSRIFHTENQSGFQIMQIYVNFMHMFMFLIIFNQLNYIQTAKNIVWNYQNFNNVIFAENVSFHTPLSL